eukprot:1160042-Pyramimonas_sp.AAC.1
MRTRKPTCECDPSVPTARPEPARPLPASSETPVCATTLGPRISIRAERAPALCKQEILALSLGRGDPGWPGPAAE